jgi:hypothetical protein
LKPQPQLTAGVDQEQLDEAADAVDHIRHRLGAAGHGYTNMVIHDGGNYLAVYWQGRIPPEVRRYVAAAEPFARVVYHSAPYNEHELTRAQLQLLRTRAATEDQVVGDAPANDGTGLEVWVNERKTGHSRAEDKRSLNSATRFVPVVAVFPGGPAVPLPGVAATQ